MILKKISKVFSTVGGSTSSWTYLVFSFGFLRPFELLASGFLAICRLFSIQLKAVDDHRMLALVFLFFSISVRILFDRHELLLLLAWLFLFSFLLFVLVHFKSVQFNISFTFHFLDSIFWLSFHQGLSLILLIVIWELQEVLRWPQLEFTGELFLSW